MYTLYTETYKIFLEVKVWRKMWTGLFHRFLTEFLKFLTFIAGF